MMRSSFLAGLLLLVVAAPAPTSASASALRRCAPLAFPAGGGGYALRVTGTRCATARDVMRRWDRANKPGPVTRVGAWRCVAEGPGATEADRIRCADGRRRIVADPYGPG